MLPLLSGRPGSLQSDHGYVKKSNWLTENLLERVFVASYKNLLEKVDTAAARKGLEAEDEADDEATTSGHGGDGPALPPRQ